MAFTKGRKKDNEMLSPGDGMAILGVCGTMITGILRMPSRKNGTHVPEKLCVERREGTEKTLNLRFDVIEKEISNTGTRMKAVEDDTKEILKYVKMK